MADMSRQGEADLMPRRRLLGRAALAAALFGLGLGSSFVAQAAESAPEQVVKAAYLYKFGSFVEWPSRAFAGPASPFVIAVLGADAVADELLHLSSGRTISGRPVQIRKVRRGEGVAGAQVVFVGRAEVARVTEVLAAAEGHSMLTVTDTDDGLMLGSVINFVVVEDRVRFDVALPPAGRGDLRISSRLLAVARKVLPGQS
jgi:hypothetical protein